MLCAATLLVTLLALDPKDARAQPSAALDSDAFRIIWSSSAGCGDSRRFLAELVSRTQRIRPAREGEHAVTFIVEMFPSPGGVRGQLTVRKPDGDLTVREVPGPDCQEVEAAMALIAALMVDPLADAAVRVGPPAPPPATAVAAERPSPVPRWRLSLLIEERTTARTAIAPGLAWGEAFAVMLIDEDIALRPAIGVSAHFARADTQQAEGSAEFEWTAAQLALCPVGWQPARGLELRPCALVQAGRLRAAGFATFAPGEKSIFWSAVGVELEGRLKLLGPLWLGLEAGLELPFSRERFFLDPERTLHRVPAVGASLGTGLGLHFE